MVRAVGMALLIATALTGGCVPTDFLNLDPSASGAAVVPSSPFTTLNPVTPQGNPTAKAPSAPPEIAIAVDKVGQQLVAANKSLGIKPLFLTVQAPQPEIFHRDTGAVFITDSLVKQCKSEGQLAALLSVELGRMVSEREVLASPAVRNPDKRPPIALTMGNAGQFSGMDQLQQAELAKLGCDRNRPTKKFVPPEPLVLARSYLDAAGFDAKEVDTVAPLLAQAEKNFVMEKQLKGPSDTPMWAPR